MTEGREEMVNDSSTPLWPVYSRTHYDLWLIYFPIWAFTPANDGSGDNAYATTFAVLLGPFMILFGAVDLPISASVDTLTLPWNIQTNKQYAKQEKAKTSIVDPLTPHEISSFNEQFKQSDNKSVILTEPETSALLSKLHGPVKDEFNNSTEKNISFYFDDDGFYFYRPSNKPERYIWLLFDSTGKYSGMTGGIGLPLPWQNCIDLKKNN